MAESTTCVRRLGPGRGWGIWSGALAAWLTLAAAGPHTARAESASAVEAGFYHTCALTAGGGVQCWGDNPYGQLGDGTTTDSSVPVAVSGLGNGVVAVPAGRFHTCALTTGGGVQCWGQNFVGQLGDGTTTDSSIPVAVSGLGSGVTAIAAGGSHSCALTTGGGVQCWGDNSYGQLGDAYSDAVDTPGAVVGFGGGGSAAVPALGLPALGLLVLALTLAGVCRSWSHRLAVS